MDCFGEGEEKKEEVGSENRERTYRTIKSYRESIL